MKKITQAGIQTIATRR